MEPRKRKRLLIGAIIVALVAGFWFFLLRNTEPTYEGKRLSEWVVIAARIYPRYTDSEKAAAANAIRAIGTNALPYLLEWISYEPSGLRESVFRNFQKGPDRFRTEAIHAVVYEPLYRATRARDTFAILGSRAAPAIPALSQIAHSTNYSTRTRSHALSALCHIGPDAVPSVLSIVSNLHQPSDLWMVGPILEMRRNARPIVPVLLSQAQNTNLNVAVTILQTSRVLPVDPDAAVPVLAKCLEDSRREVRLVASAALMEIGWPAHAALPALTNALNDPDLEIRAIAYDAIMAITGVASQ